MLAIDFEARLIAKIFTRLVFVHLKWRRLRDVTRDTKPLSRSYSHMPYWRTVFPTPWLPKTREIFPREKREGLKLTTVENRNYLGVVASCNQSPLQAEPERDGRDINETSGVYFVGKENSSPRSESKNRHVESNQRPRCQLSIKSEISFWFRMIFWCFATHFVECKCSLLSLRSAGSFKLRIHRICYFQFSLNYCEKTPHKDTA